MVQISLQQIVIRWFSRRRASHHTYAGLVADVHSHLLPGLDDGVQTLDESVAVIRVFQQLGYRKLVTTPHVMSDLYRNTVDTITNAHRQLTAHLEKQKIDITVEAAAEYYLDEILIETIREGKTLLTFGNHNLLFETNFMTEPLMLKEFIFNSKTKGYQPVLAHPERYLYLQNEAGKLEDLIHRGVLMQVNIGSLAGQYGPAAKQTGSFLVKQGWVSFLGSDCHNMNHVALLSGFLREKAVQTALSATLMNPSL